MVNALVMKGAKQQIVNRIPGTTSLNRSAATPRAAILTKLSRYWAAASRVFSPDSFP